MNAASLNLNFGYSNRPTHAELIHAQFIDSVQNGLAYTASRWMPAKMENHEVPNLIEPTRAHVDRFGPTACAISIASNLAVLVDMNSRESLSVTVAALDLDTANKELERITGKVPQPVTTEDIVSVMTWRVSKGGYTQMTKEIQVPSWPEVEVNYPSEVRKSLSDLMKMSPPTNPRQGRIILWYGPPGTGKTTALRAMAREWRDWCRVHVVSDPEKLFESADYLMEVCTGSTKAWRLVVAEDSDAFIHQGGGGSAAMGRLLNFSDGILGQSTNTLFLLTTNEDIGQLHPAVTRPGRCLAQIEFGKFQPMEAGEWLGAGPTTTEKTLAELIELRGEEPMRIVHESPELAIGNYL